MNKQHIDIPCPEHAVDIIERLQDHDFEAYIVGGYLRDHFVGLHPKDIDIVTNAEPEEIQAIFGKQCLLIGRRFRLAHIRYGRDVVEVSTFRSSHEGNEDPNQAKHQDGMIVRDNVYGTLEEDMARRDFNINALYYDPVSQTLLDPYDGIAALQQQTLHCIGDPEQRFIEDPVRITRAFRFASKLGITLPPEILDAIPHQVARYANVPAGRRFDEYTKLMLTGHAIENFALLEEFGLLDNFFPSMTSYLTDSDYYEFFCAALENTDQRIQQEKGIHPIFLVAVFLWPAYQKQFDYYLKQGRSPYIARNEAMEKLLSVQCQMMSIPRRFTHNLRQIWAMQFTLEQCRPKHILEIMSRPRFRAAYDFLLLRSVMGEVPQELAEWWAKIQEVGGKERHTMIHQVSGKA